MSRQCGSVRTNMANKMSAVVLFCLVNIVFPFPTQLMVLASDQKDSRRKTLVSKYRSDKRLQTKKKKKKKEKKKKMEINVSRDMTKPTKWVCAQQRLRSAWASALSDQSSLCAQWVAEGPRFHHTDSEDSDQTGRMPRLIRVFAGRTCHFVGFVMSRLNVNRTINEVSSVCACVEWTRLDTVDFSKPAFMSIPCQCLFCVF